MIEKFSTQRSDLLPKSLSSQGLLLGALGLTLVMVAVSIDDAVHDRQTIGNITCSGSMPVSGDKGDSIYSLADAHAQKMNLALDKEDTSSFRSIIIGRTPEKLLRQDRPDGTDLVLNTNVELNLPTECS